MAADRAGRRAGRVEQHERRGRRRAPVAHIGRDQFGREIQARQILLDPRKAIRATSTAVTRAPRAASCAVLPPGAAHRSMHGLPGNLAEQARRQVRGEILHPPAALRDNRAGLRRGRIVAAARRTSAMTRALPSPQRFARPLQHDIERRLARDARARWRARCPRQNASTQRGHSQSGMFRRPHPAPPHGLAFARHAPQHGIDQRP